jgi:hypothetical protein
MVAEDYGLDPGDATENGDGTENDDGQMAGAASGGTTA